MEQLSPQATEAFGQVAGVLRPPPPLDINEWAERHRVVPVGTSADPGRWKSRHCQAAVMRAISDPKSEGTLYVAASQGGAKTEIALNLIGYHMHYDPAPTLMVTATIDLAKTTSTDRLQPMIEATPELADRVAAARSRASPNTILHKTFPGGHVTLVGANAPAGLASRPIRVAIFDEIDRYPPSAGTEGNPLKIAEKRTVSFWNARKLWVTSPGTKGASQSEPLWMRSDRHEYFVPCPDCGHEQVLTWAQVKWERDEEGDHVPETAVYVCAKCGSCWDDVRRWRASQKGEPRPTAEFKRIHGFRFGALALVGQRLEPLVREWVEAQGNPESLKVFINTVLAEWWSDEHAQKTADETGLMARREVMPLRENRIVIPDVCPWATAGIDVQDNRFEVSVYAWGSGEESWTLAHDVIQGDPSVATTWQALEEYLSKPWPRGSTGHDYIRAACLDTGGHHTQAAYEFCAKRFRRPTPDGGLAYLFAIFGRAGKGDLWPRSHSENVKKVPLWPLQVDAGKEQIYGRLMLADPGPGYIHFPDTLEKPFFQGLTAEKCVAKTMPDGFVARTWKLRRSGARNEPLDCSVYAYAALRGLYAMGYDLETECEALVSRPFYQALPVAQRGSETSEMPPAAPQAVTPPTRQTRRRDRWVDRRPDWTGGR